MQKIYQLKQRLMQPLLALAVVCFLTATTQAGAITFTAGNNPQPNEENILLNNGQTGLTVNGVTNQTGITVRFTSTEQITAPSNGQARVEAVDGIINSPLNISIPGGSFTDFIANPQIGGQPQIGTPGTLAISVVDSTETHNFSLALGNGNNFFTIVATGGNRILSVTLTPPTTGGYNALQQPRISGAQLNAPVPEPATMLLLGTGLAGIGGAIRRRRKSAE